MYSCRNIYAHNCLQSLSMNENLCSNNVACVLFEHGLYRGSYMSAHVLLNLLNELGKRDKMRGLLSILSLFLQRV